MPHEPVTDAGLAMLDVLRQRGRDGVYDVADAFTPLIEARAPQLERRRILGTVKSLPATQGLVELRAVLEAIGEVDPE